MLRHTDLPEDDLIRSGLLVPVELGGAEEMQWLDCDLASMAENRLGDHADPRTLDDARRTDWRKRATSELPISLTRRAGFDQFYWICDGGERAGTFALATSTLGSRSVRASSFYLLPAFRGRGIGRQALLHAMNTLGKHGLGLRLDTSWCWQHAVRYYLRLGMWVYMWKHDITFCWDRRTPPPILVVGDEEAFLSVVRGDEEVVLARARRAGDALHLDAPDPRTFEEDRLLGSSYWHATSTLALAIAIEGWPLVRSPEHREEHAYADAGPPEALARKIVIWEAWDRKHGWNVETPRIPGLEYLTWDELEAKWNAQNAVVPG